jgi:hypothetical protein
MRARASGRSVAPRRAHPVPHRGLFNPAGMMRALGAAVLLAMASGCGSLTAADLNGHILVVDGSGTPIRGAVIYPDFEYSSRQHEYTKEDIEALSSNAQGMINAEMDDFLWDRDGCYHFVIRKAGYEEATLSVSKDLLPPVLRVVLAPRSYPTDRPPGAPTGR